MDNHVFANGSEYSFFLEIFCLECKSYNDWLSADADHPCCPIETAIARAVFDVKAFPFKQVHEDADGKWTCTEFSPIEGEAG
jgi:hypothetical protein